MIKKIRRFHANFVLKKYVTWGRNKSVRVLRRYRYHSFLFNQVLLKKVLGSDSFNLLKN